MSEADVPNGLRTERVTLEDVIAEPFVDSRGASETDRLRADADYLLRLFHGQANDFAEVLSVVGRISARVGRLERMLANSGSASSAAAAEQEAPAASGAAGTETDAWGVRRNGLVDCVAHRSFRKSAEGSAEQWGGIVVALYAAPQPAPGWLTAEEREALKLAADAAYDKQEDTLRSLLARSTPPEVVLPRDCGGESYDSFVAGWNNYRDEALKALAAAGVPVKEVGRE